MTSIEMRRASWDAKEREDWDEWDRLQALCKHPPHRLYTLGEPLQVMCCDCGKVLR